MQDLPPRVRAFLDEQVFSAPQLEVLLLLRGLGTPAALDDLARRTALPPGSLAPWLDAYVERGLLARDPDGAYRYAPSADLEPVVDEVADTWARRSTTMTRYIYASPTDPLLRFADAFRLRKSDGGRSDGARQADGEDS